MAQRTKICMFLLHEMKILWYSQKKSKFSFYFIVYRPMRVSDVISNVTKHNMNVMARFASLLSKVMYIIKKKIQMFVVNMTFISSREVKKKCISFGTHEIYIFSLHSMKKKSHIHSKHLNILYFFAVSDKEHIFVFI